MAFNAKMKGLKGEYEVRDMLQLVVNDTYEEWNRARVEGYPAAVPPTLKRNLEQRRSGGADIDGLSWMALEVKRQENDDMLGVWWEQTKESARCSCAGPDGVEVWKCTHPEGYDREPILIWRKNYTKWRVRQFGYLLAVDVPGGLRVKCPVDINLEAFLAYFKGKLISEIGKSLSPRPG